LLPCATNSIAGDSCIGTIKVSSDTAGYAYNPSHATVSIILYKNVRIVLAQIWSLQLQLNYQALENPLECPLKIYNLLMIRLYIGLLKAITSDWVKISYDTPMWP